MTTVLVEAKVWSDADGCRDFGGRRGCRSLRYCTALLSSAAPLSGAVGKLWPQDAQTRMLTSGRSPDSQAAPRITTTTSDDELPTVPRSGSEYYQHTGAYAYAAACSDTPPPSSRRPNDSVPRPYTSRTAPDVYRADFLQPAPCPTLRKPDPDPYYPVPGYSDDSHPGRATDGVGAYNEAIWSSSGRFAGDDELDANRRSVGGASAVANAYEYRVPTSVNVVEGYSYQPQRGNPENPRAVQMSRPYEAVGTRYEELTAAASLPAGSLRIASRGGGAELQSPPDSPTSQGFGFDGRQPLTLSELANVDLDADSFLLAAPLE